MIVIVNELLQSQPENHHYDKLEGVVWTVITVWIAKRPTKAGVGGGRFRPLLPLGSVGISVTNRADYIELHVPLRFNVLAFALDAITIVLPRLPE